MGRLESQHEETRGAWDRNAAGWDDRMGDGNAFVRELIAPAVDAMLPVREGMALLDAACGNGVFARRFAKRGARVTAFDFSEGMIARAQARGDGEGRIAYRVMDGTDEAALLSLGAGAFDAAHCGMALFDMARIDPLFRALTRLLGRQGPFVFSLMHPCFNNASTVLLAERDEEGAALRTGVRVTRYLTPFVQRGRAMDHLEPHVYYHRPLQEVLAAGFRQGFVVTDLAERAFPADHSDRGAGPGWPQTSEIPPVMVVRMELARRMNESGGRGYA